MPTVERTSPPSAGAPTAGACCEGLFTPAEVAAGLRRRSPGCFPTAEEVASPATVGRADDRLGAPRSRPSRSRPVPSTGWSSTTPHRPGRGTAGHRAAPSLPGPVSAKYSGTRDEYEQLLHVDYGNHTLVVPRADVGYRHLELFVYLSDVTPETAATRMVSRRLTGGIPVERTYLDLDEYAALYDAEVPASGPAGSVLAYRPDVYHRGTAMTGEGSARFLLHVAYKPVATDWVGFHTWPVAGEGPDVAPVRAPRHGAPAHRPRVPRARAPVLDPGDAGRRRGPLPGPRHGAVGPCPGGRPVATAVTSRHDRPPPGRRR